MISLKFFELLECLLINDLLKKFVSNHFPTALLRALQDVPLPRLLDLIFEEIFI